MCGSNDCLIPTIYSHRFPYCNGLGEDFRGWAKTAFGWTIPCLRVCSIFRRALLLWAHHAQPFHAPRPLRPVHVSGIRQAHRLLAGNASKCWRQVQRWRQVLDSKDEVPKSKVPWLRRQEATCRDGQGRGHRSQGVPLPLVAARIWLPHRLALVCCPQSVHYFSARHSHAHKRIIQCTWLLGVHMLGPSLLHTFHTSPMRF